MSKPKDHLEANMTMTTLPWQNTNKSLLKEIEMKIQVKI